MDSNVCTVNLRAAPEVSPSNVIEKVCDGQHLFEVNCSMCHGNQGKGDGPVLQKLMSPDYEYTPLLTPDLTSEQVIAMGCEGIEGFMRSGVNVMPNFSKLLNGEEMAAICEYITGTLQQ